MSYIKTSLPPLSAVNVSDRERIASVTIGSALLVNAMVTGKRFKMIKTLLAGFLLFRGTTGYCPIYASVTRHSTKNGLSAVNVRTKIIVNRSRNDVYKFWRRLENIPALMKHIAEVKTIDDRLSEWKLKGPANLLGLSWKAEIVKDEPNKLIGWQSLKGSDLRNAGKVEFIDTPDGQTEIDVIITYHPPLGATGDSLARLFTPAFRKLVESDIRNFKKVIEKVDFQTDPAAV